MYVSASFLYLSDHAPEGKSHNLEDVSWRASVARAVIERFRGWQSALALVSSEIAHLYGEDNSNAPSHSVVCDAARKKVGSHRLKQKRETPQARKRETKKPRNQEARKPRNRETKKLRNQENQKPRDPKPKKPRNLETGGTGC
jgi:hypothetical protein